MLGYLSDGVEERACDIIDGEGSVPMMALKKGENSRGMTPWPQPRSRRRFEGPRW